MNRPYIIDVNTKNISFIQTSVDLKKLGITDYKFFLRLYDKSLRGVNPYDPELPDNYIMKIINECIINPWYYFREISRIPDAGNPKGIQYQLNRANLASTWCFLNGIDNYLVIPRQIGKTQSTIAELLWAFLFGTTDSEFMFINYNNEKSIENLTRLKDQRDLLPVYLQFKLLFDDDGKEVKGRNAAKTLTNANNNNRIITKSKAMSLESAEKIGRGSTQPIQYYDEFEFIDFVKTIMEASGPAFNTASKNAKRNNSMYGRIMTSTPGDLDSRAGKDAIMIINQTCKWSESFYDDDIETVRDYIDINSKNGIMYIEYQYQQLGKDETWFHDICKLINNNPLKIKREIFLKRMRGSELSPYETEDLAAIEDYRGTIKQEIFISRIFKLDIYTELNKDKIYFVGVDVANGYGADNSAVTIFDPYELQPVAEFKSPNIGVKDLITFITILIRKYIPKSILAIERNANGEAVLDHLRSTDIITNIYYDNNKDIVEEGIDSRLDAEGFVKRESARRKLYGIWTGTKSRERMFSLLDGHIKDYKDKFICANIIDDIMRLVRNKQGKIVAGEGFHDDSIMSYLMCLYLYYYGNNLHRYGFVRGQLPVNEKQNSGLTYDDVSPYLSDNDKEFFKGVQFESKSDIDQITNIKGLIEQNRGLVNERELKDSVINDNKLSINKINNTIPMNSYQAKLYAEMQQAQKESEEFNKRLNLKTSYENMDVDTDGEESLDWFDEFI